MATAELVEVRTPADLLIHQARHEGRFELIDGVIRKKPYMGADAAGVAEELRFRLREHVRDLAVGRVLGPDCGFKCFPHRPGRVRLPDAALVRTDLLPNRLLPSGHLSVVPELAIEVVSRRNSAQEIQERVDDYLRARVRLVWILYPSRWALNIFRPDGTGGWVGPEGVIDGEDVLPGFRCPMAELFVGIAAPQIADAPPDQPAAGS